MANGNVRVRERFELALDGRQIASIVVGALVTVSAVFVLGLQMGQHLAARQALASRPADLAALDRPLASPGAPAAAPALQFADKLPRQKPAPPPPLEPARPASTAATVPPPAPPQPAAPAALAAAAPERAAPPAGEVVVPAPPPAAATATATAGKAFTVQLASATLREDANKVVARVKGHGPRIVEADVPGKGHYFRVRVGRFDDREAAERFRDDLARETGMQGVVMPE
jgi:cell division septation protein DedD